VREVSALFGSSRKGEADDAETISSAILGMLASRIRRGETESAPPPAKEDMVRLARILRVSEGGAAEQARGKRAMR
jgi:hypothetical protein